MKTRNKLPQKAPRQAQRINYFHEAPSSRGIHIMLDWVASASLPIENTHLSIFLGMVLQQGWLFMARIR
jgi:hypothetical protein